MQPAISHITLGVGDLDQSIHFYRDGFGFTPRGTQHGAVWFPLAGGTTLVLYPTRELQEFAGAVDVAEWTGFRGVLLSHNVDSADAVEAILRRAEHANGRVVRKAFEPSWGGVVGIVADPDDHRWEIVWNPSRHRNGSVKRPADGHPADDERGPGA